MTNINWDDDEETWDNDDETWSGSEEPKPLEVNQPALTAEEQEELAQRLSQASIETVKQFMIERELHLKSVEFINNNK